MWTEKMDEILTSPAARRIVPQLSPIYGDAYVALWLFNAIGREIDNMELRTQELSLQALPQTTTWGIPYWEEDYGIPSNENLSVEERRREVLSRIRTRAPMNPQWIKTVLETLTGTSVQIVENISKNRFELIFGDVLGNSIKVRAKNKLEEIKPAHLIYLLTQILQLSIPESERNFSEYTFYLHVPEEERLLIPLLSLSIRFKSLTQSAMDIIIRDAFLYPQQMDWQTLLTFSFLNVDSFMQDASELCFSFSNKDTTIGTLAYHRPWKFNGEFCFDGSHQFNSGDSEEVI